MTMPNVEAGQPRASGDSDRVGGRTGLVRYVRVGRQGIYDPRRNLVGYELLFRTGPRGTRTRSRGSRPPRR